MRELSFSRQGVFSSSERSVRICSPLTNMSIVLRKKLGLEMLTCIIKSKVQGSNEFILHAPDCFDLRIQCDRRDAFIDLLKLRFAHMKPDVTLKVYGVVSNVYVCKTYDSPAV